MKLLKTLVCAAALLTSASVFAADAPLPSADTAKAAVEAPQADQATPEAGVSSDAKKDCDPAADMFKNEWQVEEKGFNSCGSCSSSNCRGALRGQSCWTGSGWGNCNIYSGGYRCSTGGWECQCGTGPLP